MLDQSPAARLQRLRHKSTLHRSSRVWRTCPCSRSRADAITRPFSRVRPAHYMWSVAVALYPNLGGLSRSCGRDHGMGVGRAKGSEAGRGPVGSSHQADRLRGLHNHCPHLRRSRYVIRPRHQLLHHWVDSDSFLHSVYTWEARKLGQAGYAPQLVEALQDKGVVKVLNDLPSLRDSD